MSESLKNEALAPREGEPLSINEVLEAFERESAQEFELKGPLDFKLGGVELYYKANTVAEEIDQNNALNTVGMDDWVYLAVNLRDKTGQKIFNAKKVGLYKDRFEKLSASLVKRLAVQIMEDTKSELSEEDLGNSSEQVQS